MDSYTYQRKKQLACMSHMYMIHTIYDSKKHRRRNRLYMKYTELIVGTALKVEVKYPLVGVQVTIIRISRAMKQKTMTTMVFVYVTGK